MEVKVNNNKGNLEMPIRTLRKKVQREGLIREARLRKAYEKPSEKRKRRLEESLIKTIRNRKKNNNY